MNSRSKTQNLQQLTKHLVETVIPDNLSGFTMDSVTRAFPLLQKDQYVVSFDGYEKRLSHPVEIEEVFSWVSTNAHTFENRFIGGWLDPMTNEFVLDISIAITGKQNVIDFGLLNNQTDIYHQFSDKTLQIIKREVA